MTRALKFLHLFEGGQTAGTIEVHATPVEHARAYAERVMASFDRTLDEEIPAFIPNYIGVQLLATNAHARRAEMPVIDDHQVRHFQNRLAAGLIDVNPPYAAETDPANPFPEGLTGQQAQHFLRNGAPRFDHAGADDDRVSVMPLRLEIGRLKPIQRQIYLDKVMPHTAKNGAEDTLRFLTTTNFIVSADNFIIDGHHRWLSGNLIDPDIFVGGIVIDLPLAKLLPLSKAYGDAIGNERNG